MKSILYHHRAKIARWASLYGLIFVFGHFFVPVVHAVDECGALPDADDGTITVDCDSTNYEATEGDIAYSTATDDLVLNVEDGLEVGVEDGETPGIDVTHTGGGAATGDVTLNVGAAEISTSRDENAADPISTSGIRARIVTGNSPDDAGAGNIAVNLTGTRITTSGINSPGVEMQRFLTASDLEMALTATGATISTAGTGSAGIQLRFIPTGDATAPLPASNTYSGIASVRLDRGTTITTTGIDSPGIEVYHDRAGSGGETDNVGILIDSSATITTEGDGSSGIHARLSSGILHVRLREGARIRASGGGTPVDENEPDDMDLSRYAHGLLLEHDNDDNDDNGNGGTADTVNDLISLRVDYGAHVEAQGVNAHGIAVESNGLNLTPVADAADACEGGVGLCINGVVRGGGRAADATGTDRVAGGGRAIWLSDGGHITVRDGGVLSAASGVAVESAAGDLRLDIVGSGAVLGRLLGSMDDNTTVVANGVTLLSDNDRMSGAGGSTLWAYNGGIYDLSLRDIEGEGNENTWEFVRAYSSRAFAFEALPQTLLKLNQLQDHPGSAGEYGKPDSWEGWVRFSGQRSKQEIGAGTSLSSYDQRWWQVSVGVDGPLPWKIAGDWTAGAYLHYADSHTDEIVGVGPRPRNGEINSDASGWGAHLNWHRDEFYAAFQGKVIWNDGDIQAAHLDTGFDAFGYSLGIEAGQKMKISEQLHIIPQAQLSYLRVDIDDLSVAARTIGEGDNATVLPGYRVGYDNSVSLRGRLGLGMEWQPALTAGHTNKRLYGRVGMLMEFDGETSGTVGRNTTQLQARPERVWGEVKMGGEISGMLPSAGQDSEYAFYAAWRGAFTGNSHELGAEVGLQLRF